MCCPVTLQIAFPAAFAADGDLNVTRVRLGDSSFAYDAARDAPWGAAPRDSTADDDDAAVMGTWSARLLRAPVDGNATIELARSGNGRWLGAGVQLTVTTKDSGGVLRHGDYQGSFTVPSDGKVHDAVVAWKDFTCNWRGEPIKCPDMQSEMAKIEKVGLSFGQAPNVPGQFHIEIMSVSAVSL